MQSHHTRYPIGEIMQRHAASFIEKYKPHPVVQKALHDISICRTPRLGGRKMVCDNCNDELYLYNSCGNRNCPICQSVKREIWIEKRVSQMLPVKHFHVVFTLPHELNTLIMNNMQLLYNALFQTSWQTIKSLCEDEKHLGANPAMITMLHT